MYCTPPKFVNDKVGHGAHIGCFANHIFKYVKIRLRGMNA